MNVTWYEKGVAKGREEGIEKGEELGRRAMLREQLEHYFGPLSPAVVERLQQLPSEQILSIGKLLRQAQSLKDLGLED
jgi:flagellar biosynthesis/type III secretory pathway protein FliH